MEVALVSLLTQLGAVCDVCSTYSEPGVGTCVRCGAELKVVDWVRTGGAPQEDPLEHLEIETAPGPVEAAPSLPAAVAPAPAEAPKAAPREAKPTTIRRPGVPPIAGVGCWRCGARQPAGVVFCPACGARLEPAPAPGRRQTGSHPLSPDAVRLALLRGLGPAGTTFSLAAGETKVGRGPGAIRFPTDDTLAPHAATLRFAEGRLVIRDESGATFVRIRQPEPLRPGARIAIGDHLLRFAGVVPAPQREADGQLRYGSPIPSGAPLLRLESLLLGGEIGRAWLRQGPIRIGRALGDVLLPDDPFVSARHCEIDADPEGAIVRDLGSSNGTFVQLAPDTERELQLGDTVRVGRNILRLEAKS